MMVPETPKTEVNNATVPEISAAIITLKCLTKLPPSFSFKL